MTLFELFHHKWAMPVLAEVFEPGGGRFAALTKKLGASQGAMRQTLAHLVEIGLLEKDSLYGHPLRPEFNLTRVGKNVAQKCRNLSPHLQDHPSLADSKWAIATIAELGSRRRFSELRDALPSATDRALSQALKTCLQAQVAVRKVTDDFPPTTQYELADGTEDLLQAVRELQECLKALD